MVHQSIFGKLASDEGTVPPVWAKSRYLTSTGLIPPQPVVCAPSVGMFTGSCPRSDPTLLRFRHIFPCQSLVDSAGRARCQRSGAENPRLRPGVFLRMLLSLISEVRGVSQKRSFLRRLCFRDPAANDRSSILLQYPSHNQCFIY